MAEPAPAALTPFAAGLPEVVWPALATAEGQLKLALQFQLQRTQWWSSERLADHQFWQLRELLAHAVANVPFYRHHLRRAQVFSLAGLTPAGFSRWPILSRAELRSAADDLRALRVPAGHGGMQWATTTGSTGQPVRVATTDAAAAYQAAAVLRSHRWYGLDLRRKFATIRPGGNENSLADWGDATRHAFTTGPCVTFAIARDIGEQLLWLCREQPAYLLSVANNLRLLLLESRRTGLRPQGLMALLSFADLPPPDLLQMAREVWDVPVFDSYSAAEVGTIALQCPERAALHVQAENLLLEVLHDDGTPCGAGETGRVVVTDLHNFAMPLIRYALGDHARVGEPCPCGRGLPVLQAIAGRTSNMAVDPTGRRFWPLLSPYMWPDSTVLQRQLVQHSPSMIEVHYVADQTLSDTQVAELGQGLARTLRYGFDFRFVRVAAIEPAPGGKFQEFISLLEPPPT